MHSFFDLTYFREVGQKYRNIFVRFLVQMKTSKSHSEINWLFITVWIWTIISHENAAKYTKIGMFLQNGIHSIVNHTICTYYLQFSPFTVPPVHPANMANAAAAYASRNRPFERNPTTWVPPSAPQRNGE